MSIRHHTLQNSARRRRRNATFSSVLLHLIVVFLMAFSGGQHVEVVEKEKKTVVMKLVDVSPPAVPGTMGPPPPPAPTPEPVVPSPPEPRARKPTPTAPRATQKQTAPEVRAEPQPETEPASAEPVAAGGAVRDSGRDGGLACAGQRCDGIQEVGASRVMPKRRVRPDYPAAAKALGLDETTCQARFTINTRGKPTDVQVNGCPEAFHQEVRRAGYQWSFYQVRGPDGQPIVASFTLNLTFRLR